MTDLTDEALDALITKLGMIHEWKVGVEAAAVITALRQREAEAVAGAIEAASGIAMDFHVRALVWAKSVPGLDKHVGETDSYRIAAAIRALHTDATSTALDRAKAEGMREAAGIAQSAETPVFKDGWSAGQDAAAISTMGSISRAILAAADKLEGKS